MIVTLPSSTERCRVGVSSNKECCVGWGSLCFKVQLSKESHIVLAQRPATTCAANKYETQFHRRGCETFLPVPVMRNGFSRVVRHNWASHPSFRLRRVFQRRGRLANEAAEIRKQLTRGRDTEREVLALSALEEASDSVLEALLRSAVAGVELLEMREVRPERSSGFCLCHGKERGLRT